MCFPFIRQLLRNRSLEGAAICYSTYNILKTSTEIVMQSLLTDFLLFRGFMVRLIDSLHREYFNDGGIFIVMSLYSKNHLNFCVFITVDLPLVNIIIIASGERDAMISLEECSNTFVHSLADILHLVVNKYVLQCSATPIIWVKNYYSLVFPFVFK